MEDKKRNKVDEWQQISAAVRGQQDESICIETTSLRNVFARPLVLLFS